MISRRTFIQGTAGAIGAALAFPALAAEPGRLLRIDSIEMPRFAAGPDRIRLSGNQLDRFAQLGRALGGTGPVTVETHLDGAGQVLLDAALNASGRRVGPARHRADGATFTILS
ncbi:twin-arginine translocation signal domain-containing protein [Paracoccus limosus]|jgi:hypothetical protein|uniref:Twin-arginine translocation signal domain-containing protein n=1 Tax=Paracoccus limosus TaxID=913252 RepID=A0A844H7Q1_9RHOB|nr:twin-arginine translocation signal domain-containing protein [Paracoccus limosus]MTH35500.1 twin-arginine translocation signal domain-containing protein [Paracoccus limosus]